ncbi:MAG: AAA family ATPase, partial [Candidatus Marinimicrobia bacterium]|nr:AAA family ATPase [Candidatus Neomarinimicrobiota bacterium]
MKILELRFKNLNSLYGEWLIDFTDPEYVTNGIFALTGPTGAGKSTALDAICLALYGHTPRLGKITKSGNEIMSRQTGECYAEVLFESSSGRFRCHWSQHRARKSASGDLQSPQHEISEGIENGQVIESQLRSVATAIEEKTGMDFDRFTRSILLAQGGFDTFLKANIEEKSKILEQITGTKIYTEISRRVHERQRDERDKLNILQAETAGITILEKEQEKEIQQDFEATQKQEKELIGKATKTDKAITWLTAIESLKKEIQSLTQEAGKLQTDIEVFKPERGKLEQAINAASLDGSYATLTATRKQQSGDQTSLEAEEKALPELEVSANTQAESLKAAEQLTLKTKKDLKAEAQVIQEVRSLDEKIADQAKAVSESEASCKKDATKIDADKQSQIKEQTKRSETEKTQKTAEQYLKEHAQDEWLISGLAGIEEQFNNLLARQREIAQKETDFKNVDTASEEAVKKHSAAAKQCTASKKELEEAATKLQQGNESLAELLGDQLLREYRAEKEALQKEKEYQARIAALEEHRTKLEDGEPCPLCGSKEHPFAEGNVPVSDEIEQKIETLTKLITRTEDQEATIKNLEEVEAVARKNLNEIEKLETRAANDKQVAEKALAELKGGLKILRTGFEKLKLAVSQKLQPLGITEIREGQVSALLESLKSRLNAWQEQISKKDETGKQAATIDTEINHLNAVIETQSKALTEKQESLERLKGEYSSKMDDRKKLYGDKFPDDEEDRLNKAVADVEDAEKTARILNTELQQNFNTAKAQVESLKKQIEQRLPELKKAETDFSSALEPAGFSNEKQFLEARLTNEEREALSYRAKELDNAQTDLVARQKDRETRLATETTKKVTDKSLDELEPQLKAHEESLKALRDTIASLKHQLSENIAAKERIKEKQAVIEAQKTECRRWGKLHDLIGSADGKKYRNFAQGLTFELMVSHANQQLEKMTDRYLLIRDDKQPLELNVVDNYQAGEIRSTKNLSGGESFIVSLTLALGLSKMASRKVRVDSLFLDEGFGTLDEETLETALETLSSLHQDGKLIGIISHIPALKERISTQISIDPISGG